MTINKKTKYGKWVLIHRRYSLNGFESDFFELIDTEKKQKMYISESGILRVCDYDPKFPINKIKYEYTKSDYLEIIKREISKI